MGRGAIPSRLGFGPGDMRRPGVIRYYPRFPEAIPEEGAGSPRVTQPFATRFPPRWGAVRLACVRRAASVHPEPGSNSPSNAPVRTGYMGAVARPAGCNADRIHSIKVVQSTGWKRKCRGWRSASPYTTCFSGTSLPPKWCSSLPSRSIRFSRYPPRWPGRSARRTARQGSNLRSSLRHVNGVKTIHTSYITRKCRRR